MEIWIYPKILEGKLKEQCSTLGCIQDQDLLGYVKTQVVWPHTLNLTSLLMMLSLSGQYTPTSSLPTLL